jgi:hypothetical protein
LPWTSNSEQACKQGFLEKEASLFVQLPTFALQMLELGIDFFTG